MYDIVVLVTGRLGIVYSLSTNCDGEKYCTFYLDDVRSKYEEMKPGARIVVYSIESHNRRVRYGYTTIKFKSLSSNYVS